MGLDMFFYKKIYVGANYEHNKITGRIALNRDGVPIKIQLSRVTYITEEIGYLRKANAIHAWLVENIQDGVDECQEAFFPLRKRKELLTLCKKALKKDKQALRKLQPQEGFFFGNTDQDKWYFQDLKEMIKILSKLNNDDNIYYQSSW